MGGAVEEGFELVEDIAADDGFVGGGDADGADAVDGVDGVSIWMGADVDGGEVEVDGDGISDEAAHLALFDDSGTGGEEGGGGEHAGIGAGVYEGGEVLPGGGGSGGAEADGDDGGGGFVAGVVGLGGGGHVGLGRRRGERKRSTGWGRGSTRFMRTTSVGWVVSRRWRRVSSSGSWSMSWP